MRVQFLLVLAACGPTLEVGSHTDPILAGQADATTSVFLLDLRFSNGDAAICSAVLISPRVLLTAAHCVEPALHGSASVTVRATNKANDSNLMASDFTAVTLLERHPQWSASATSSPYDVAGLLLAANPGVAPSPLQRSLPANLVGQPLRLVGYGRTAATSTDSGTRRSASATVTAVTADVLTFGVSGTSGVCGGDSGGPSFLRGADQVERVAGIHSRTRSSECGVGDDIRVDTRLAFIDGFVAAHDPPACTRDARCVSGCPSPDPDCAPECGANGICTGQTCPTPDPDCGDCGANGSCAAATCPVADPDCAGCGTNGVCVRGACAPTDPDCARCGSDGTCVGGACPTTDPDCTAACGANGTCAPFTCPAPDPDCADCGANAVCAMADCPARDPDCLDDGQVCTTASECTGHQCLQDPRGFRFCSRTCTTSSECQLDLVCGDGRCRAPGQPLDPARGSCAAAPGDWALLAALVVGRRRNRGKVRA